MKAILEEYGMLVIGAIIAFVLVLGASPIGTMLHNGVKSAVEESVGIEPKIQVTLNEDINPGDTLTGDLFNAVYTYGQEKKVLKYENGDYTFAPTSVPDDATEITVTITATNIKDNNNNLFSEEIVFPVYKTYTVTYMGNGFTGGNTESSTFIIDQDQKLQSNGYTRTGYHFKGWNTAADGSGTMYDEKSFVKNLATEHGANVVLYAQWLHNTYQIIYNSNGNADGTTEPSIHTYDVAEPLTANGYTNNGRTFLGWNTEADGSGVFYSDQQHVKNLADGGTVMLFAQWSNNGYTIVYNGNGNTGGSTASSNHTYAEQSNLTANGYTKAGYKFVGWNTAADGSGTMYKDGELVRNLAGNGTVTLYAQWEELSNTMRNGSYIRDYIPDEVVKVKFTDEMAPSGATLIDVSSKRDMGIVAWVDGTTFKVSSQRSGKEIVVNKSTSLMFSSKSNLTSVDFSNLSMNNIETMSSMFRGCSNLTLDCSSWDVDTVTLYSHFNDGAPGVIAPNWVN